VYTCTCRTPALAGGARECRCRDQGSDIVPAGGPRRGKGKQAPCVLGDYIGGFDTLLRSYSTTGA
jgi:hypothetical protein